MPKRKQNSQSCPAGDEEYLQAEIGRMVEELEEAERQITWAMGRSKALMAEMYALSGELSESNTLRVSNQELFSQYHGDIQRLDNIVDGEYHRHDLEGNATCPFCDGKIDPRKEESYVEASQAELTKIRMKLEDLQLADNDLVTKQSTINQRIAELSAERSGVEDLINSKLKPKVATIRRALVGYRYAIEIRKETSVIGDMEGKLQQDLFRTMTEEESADSDFKIKSHYDATFFKGLNDRLDVLLKAVQYEKYSTVHVNTSSFDMVVNGQDKMIHGKGYRAFQNMVMALALAEFLAAKGTYAPSMLIIDSPIQSLEESIDDKTPDTMKIGLFRYLLESSSLNQVIIIENKIPPTLNYSTANMIEFTKGKKPGRYGLLNGVQS